MKRGWFSAGLESVSGPFGKAEVLPFPEAVAILMRRAGRLNRLKSPPKRRTLGWPPARLQQSFLLGSAFVVVVLAQRDHLF
jgi:hypothetical protein